MCREMNFNLEPQVSDSHAKGFPVPRSSLPGRACGAGQAQAALQPASARGLVRPRRESAQTVTCVPQAVGLDLEVGVSAEHWCLLVSVLSIFGNLLTLRVPRGPCVFAMAGPAGLCGCKGEELLRSQAGSGRERRHPRKARNLLHRRGEGRRAAWGGTHRHDLWELGLGARRGCTHSQTCHPRPLLCPSWKPAESGPGASRLQGLYVACPADGAGDPPGVRVRTHSKVLALRDGPLC